MGIDLCLLALAISTDLSRSARRTQNPSSTKLTRSAVSYPEHDNPSWQYWHPSRSSPSSRRVASVQLPKSSPVVFQVPRVSQTVFLLVTSMAHMNRCPLSTTVNSQNSSSSLVAPSTRSPVGSEVRAKIQSTSSVTRQHRRQDHSCRRAALHLQSRSLGFAILCCQRC